MAAGHKALYANTTGSNNTALGYQAGDVITNGSSNVILGSSADPSDGGGTNQIVIGYGATGHGDNIAVIGNGSLLAIHPKDDNEVDLGSSTYEYKDLYVDGTANVDALNLDGTAVTATAAELNIMDGVTATAAELNIIDGVTATTAELNYVDGVTSAVQTQLDAKQALDADLTDLADGTLTATLVQYGSLFITSAGTSGEVWTSDGTGVGGWGSAATTVTGLSDALVEDNSMYIGNDPASTTSSALKNVAIGTTALDAIIGGDNNVAVGYDALTANTSGSKNTALGYQAGDVITTGSENVLLGSGADPSANSATNQIVIGRNATGHGNNITVIGNGSNTAIHPHDDGEVDLGSSTYEYKDLYVDGVAYMDAIDLNGTAVSATAAELNIIDGVTATTAELNIIDGVTATTAELNYVDGVTSAVQTQLDAKQALDADLTDLADGTLTATLVQYGSYFIPSAGTDGQVWTSDGSGVGGWASTGAFTTASASTALKTPLIEYTDGTDALTIASDGAVTTAGNLSVGGDKKELQFHDAGGNYVGFEAPDLSANQIWILPAVDGSANQVIQTDGDGTLAWVTRSTATDVDGLSDAEVVRNNVYIGNEPASNSGDNKNVAVGVTALDAITSGDYNVAIGYDALTANTTAGNNTAIGYQAGDVIVAGANNVIIGHQADPSAHDATNQIVIGYGATGQGTNYAVIGNASVTRLYAAQDGAAVLYANGTINTSDSRVKRDINDLEYGLDFINSLRPVTYYKKDPMDYSQELKDKFYPNGNVRTERHAIDKVLQLGFIAQEVKQVNDEMGLENNIVVVDEDGFHRMDYQKIIVPLVKAVQEQQDQIKNLMRKYEELAAQNQKLLDMMSN